MVEEEPPRDKSLIRLGWWEWVHLPGVIERPIKAKCDTGATTSALHAEGVEIFHRGELKMVKFSVMHDGPTTELRVVSEQHIKSSNGETQVRPLVLVPVLLAGVTFAIECTLTDRTPMAYPMLLGRNALAGRFLVDPAEVHLNRKPRGTR